MPSLPSLSTLWNGHLEGFLPQCHDTERSIRQLSSIRQQDANSDFITSSLSARLHLNFRSFLFYSCLIITCVVFSSGTDALFQYSIFESRSSNWNSLLQGTLRVLCFLPLDITIVCIIFFNLRKIFTFHLSIIIFFVACESTACWLLSFYYFPCIYGGRNCHINPHFADFNMSFNFTPHIWFWLLLELLIKWTKWAIAKWSNETNKNNNKNIRDKEALLLSSRDMELKLLSSDSNSMTNQHISDNNSRSGPDNINAHYNDKSQLFCILIIMTINCMLFGTIFGIFSLVRSIAGASIWLLEHSSAFDTLQLYWSILITICLSKAVIKKVARWVDQHTLKWFEFTKNDHEQDTRSRVPVSYEIIMEIHLIVIYNVTFRFLFPILIDFTQFVFIKSFHIFCDIFQNWIRATQWYHKLSSKITNKYILTNKGLKFGADTTRIDDWNTRVVLDSSIRLIISVCEGASVLLLDWILLPAVLGWQVKKYAIYYTIASVGIDTIVFVLSLIVIPGRWNYYLKPNEPLYLLMVKNSIFYSIFLVLSMTYSMSFFGVPAAMFTQKS